MSDLINWLKQQNDMLAKAQDKIEETQRLLAEMPAAAAHARQIPKEKLTSTKTVHEPHKRSTMETPQITAHVWKCPKAPPSMRFIAAIVVSGTTEISGGEVFPAWTATTAKRAALSSKRAEIEQRKIARAAHLAEKARQNVPKKLTRRAGLSKGYAYLMSALLVENRTYESIGDQFNRSKTTVQQAIFLTHRRLKHPLRRKMLQRAMPNFEGCDAFLKASTLAELRLTFSALTPDEQAIVLTVADNMNADAPAANAAGILRR